MELIEKKKKEILSLVDKAAEAVLDIYKSVNLGIKKKKDNSPITLADEASHHLLTAGLKKLYPDIPVISEEEKITPYNIRKNWPYFWLLDPLDGTKEFILKNGEFTINLALIEKDTPIIGIIAAPTKRLVYFAAKGGGAYKKEAEGSLCPIKAKNQPGNTLVATRSRSHKNKREESILAKLGKTKTIHAGSALKFCLVAEGRADIYLRGGPTMEWDTAAGQCIAAEAGAKTYTLEGQPFLYNKKSLLNPGLICTAMDISSFLTP